MIYFLILSIFLNLFWFIKIQRLQAPKTYIYVTQAHRDGDILPSEGSDVVMFDGTKNSIKFSVQRGTNRPRFDKVVLKGPILQFDTGDLIFPAAFWASVKSINGIEVVN